jgi:hypothetical protein
MMLRQKLHFQEQFIRKYGIHVNNVRDADQMKECVDILDRLIEDDYHSTAFAEHDERWGKAELNWFDIDDDPEHGTDLVELKITHPKVKTDEDNEQERNDFRKACEREDYLRQSDLRLLFENMRQNIQGWWD